MSGAAIATALVATAVAVDTTTTLAIVAAVGATIGAVGVVTHNQALTIAGGVIGAVGAIGGLASAAGIFDGAATSSSSLFGTGVGDTDVGSIAADAGAPASVSAQGQTLIEAGIDPGAQSTGINSAASGASSSGSGDVVNNVAGTVTPPTGDVPTSMMNGQSPNVTPAAATDTGTVPIPQGDGGGGTLGAVDNAGATTTPAAAPMAPADGSPLAPVPGAPAAPGTPSAVTTNILGGGQGVTGIPAAGTTVTGAPLVGQSAGGLSSTAGAVAGAGTSTTPSAFSNVLSFIKGNQTLAAGTIQAGAALIAGATSSLTPAQVNALNAQAAANQAAANLSAQQLSNIQSGVPTASRTPAGPGLINTTPQPSNVTGAPA